VRQLTKEKSTIEEERKELLKQRAKLELEVEETEARTITDRENQEVGTPFLCLACLSPTPVNHTEIGQRSREVA